MSQRGPGPIPNRWLHCPRKSESTIADHFIAFKTPLSSAYNGQMPLECIFTPEMIFDYCKAVKLKLGLWIDLTNTKRFYDRRVVDSYGVKYVKLQCRGHGETPSPEQTQSFIELVDNFINERPLDIIAVHCTHGFNRTGFLIASYLVERLDYSVEAALAVFGAARPPGIYKQDYINELFRLYDNESESLVAPELPLWCLEYDDSNSNSTSNKGVKRAFDGNQSSTSQQAHTARMLQQHGEDGNFEDNSQFNEDSNSTEPRRKKRRRELIIENATFMSGVPGVAAITDPRNLAELQLKAQDMCDWEKSGFPGAQPVSMTLENINYLHHMPYMVSWKADGTRYMMLINDRNQIYFFDRNHSCFQVENMTFLKAGNLNEHLRDTLLDGEMVLDKDQGNIIPRYLIYDIVKISGFDIGKKPFPERLQCIKKEIIEPRYEGIANRIIDKSKEPFSIRQKDFWDIRTSDSLLGEKFAKALLHEPDGLIFQPRDQPYTTGVCQHVLKWKPSEMNSVDFRLKITKETGLGVVEKLIGLLYVGGRNDVPFAKIKCTKTLRGLDNKIIECTVNHNGEWEFMRERTDKTLPNSFNTAEAVIQSIRKPVTKDYLLNFIAKYGFYKRHEMPPPANVPHMQRAQHQQFEHSH